MSDGRMLFERTTGHGTYRKSDFRKENTNVAGGNFPLNH